MNFSERSEYHLGILSSEHMTLLCLRIVLSNTAQPHHTTVNKEGSTKRLLLGLFPCTGFLVAKHQVSFSPPKLQSLIKHCVYQFSHSLLRPCKETSCQMCFSIISSTLGFGFLKKFRLERTILLPPFPSLQLPVKFSRLHRHLVQI